MTNPVDSSDNTHARTETRKGSHRAWKCNCAIGRNHDTSEAPSEPPTTHKTKPLCDRDYSEGGKYGPDTYTATRKCWSCGQPVRKHKFPSKPQCYKCNGEGSYTTQSLEGDTEVVPCSVCLAPLPEPTDPRQFHSGNKTHKLIQTTEPTVEQILTEHLGSFVEYHPELTAALNDYYNDLANERFRAALPERIEFDDPDLAVHNREFTDGYNGAIRHMSDAWHEANWYASKALKIEEKI